MPLPAGEHEANRCRVDGPARLSGAFELTAVGGELERVPLRADAVTLRALMPGRETYGWGRVCRVDATRGSKILGHRGQPEVADSQLGLKACLSYRQGGKSGGTFPVFKPHGHEGALLQIDDRADAVGRDQLRPPDLAERLHTRDGWNTGLRGQSGSKCLLGCGHYALPDFRGITFRTNAVDGSTSRIVFGVGHARLPLAAPSSAEHIRCGAVRPNGAFFSQ